MAQDTTTTTETKTTKTAKAPNYTPEQEATLMARYSEAPIPATVSELATEFGKATRSIVAKLSKMGIYVKPGYTTKTGEKPVKKNELADTLGEKVGLSPSEVDSLEKANKTALNKVLAYIAAKEAEIVQAENDLNEILLDLPRNEENEAVQIPGL